MEFKLHNEVGIDFPTPRPMFRDGVLFFERFRELIPRDGHDSIIGSGGTGVIHLVRDELLGRTVALKLPIEEVRRDPGARRDVLNETRHAVELTHRNIVRVHDFHEGIGGWGISMQYVRGRNLDELRHAGAGMDGGFLPDRVAGWIKQLCDALIHAHEDAGIVHRDIKPRNLMLETSDEGEDRIFVTDFGITRRLRQHTLLLSRSQSSRSEQETMGTLPYMPWEQIKGEAPQLTDDIYSIGATIYELITGKPPFYSGGQEQIRVQVETVVPPSMADRLRELRQPDHGIPRDWESVVAACLAKDPTDRPQSVRELANALGLSHAESKVEVLPASSEVNRLNVELDERRLRIEELESHERALLEEKSTHQQDFEKRISDATRELKRITARPLAEAAARIALLERERASG